MAVDDDQTGQSAGTGTQSGTGSATGTTGDPTTGTGTQSGTDPNASTDSNTKPTTVSREDFERIQNQLRAADQRRQAAETKAQQLEDAKLSEAERTVKQLEEFKTQNSKLQNDIKDLRIQNAFLTDNTHEWHDPRAALKLADLSGVEIGEDGVVKGLKEALDAVAKASPFLVKPKGETDGGSGEGGSGSGGSNNNGTVGVTGVGGGGNGASGNDMNSLAKRFPQLMGRVS